MKRPPKKWIRACMAAVEEHGGADSPGAVCGAVWKRKSKAAKRAAMQGEKDMPRKKHHKKHHTKHRKHHCYSSTKTGKPSKHGRYVTCHKRGKRTTRRKSR